MSTDPQGVPSDPEQTAGDPCPRCGAKPTPGQTTAHRCVDPEDLARLRASEAEVLRAMERVVQLTDTESRTIRVTGSWRRSVQAQECGLVCCSKCERGIPPEHLRVRDEHHALVFLRSRDGEHGDVLVQRVFCAQRTERGTCGGSTLLTQGAVGLLWLSGKCQYPHLRRCKKEKEHFAIPAEPSDRCLICAQLGREEKADPPPPRPISRRLKVVAAGRRKKWRLDQVNERVLQELGILKRANRKITLEALHEATGCPESTIGDTPAWKRFGNRRRGRPSTPVRYDSGLTERAVDPNMDPDAASTKEFKGEKRKKKRPFRPK